MRRRTVRTALGLGVSVLLLWWVFRDVSLPGVVAELRGADPLLFLAALGIATAGFAFRALRWQVHLAPVSGRIPFRPRFAATTLGFAANNLLPARVGEVVRALALSRVAPVPAGAALGALVVERILDGFVLVFLLFLVMATPGFPAPGRIAGVDLRAAAALVAAAMLFATLLLLVAARRPDRAVALVEAPLRHLLPLRLSERIASGVRSFLAGLVVLGRAGLAVRALGWTLAQWAFLAFSFLLAFRAFGIEAPGLAGAVFLQSVVSLAVAIPSSPGFFGPFEAAAVLGLSPWGVPRETAVSFAIGFHLGGFVPVTLIGLWYLARLDLRLGELRREAEEG